MQKLNTQMQTTELNNTQLYLLKMFSFVTSDSELNDIKQLLADYYAKKVERDMDKLWNDGLWNANKNEEILKEHLRTPYK